VLAVGAVALGLGIWAFLALVHAPRRKRSRYTGRVAEVVDGDETTRLPFESMSEVVFERRR
jgi:NO-binding membrane sensor protein with MHYT domain